jgi:NAD(P)-dependent dehydrogenase (short-subunit alcohol dehydrogenase family)
MSTVNTSDVMLSISTADFAGRRILLTGSTGEIGLVLSDVLAKANARLVVCGTPPPACVASAQPHYDRMLADTQAAVRDLGGLDCVVSLVELEQDQIAEAILLDDVEAYCRDVLAGPLAALRVALNRMETTWVEGAVVTALIIPPGLTGGEQLVAQVVRSMISEMVRHEAGPAARHGISLRAVIVDHGETDETSQPVAAILSAIGRDAGCLSGIAIQVY